MGARYVSTIVTQATMTSRTILVEHIQIASSLPFAEVRLELEGCVTTA